MAMLKQEDERETSVTLDDQMDINRFSRLLNERHEIESFVGKRQELNQLFEDASDELILADDDEPVQFAVGDAFIFTGKEDAELRIEDNKAKLAAEIDVAKKKIESIQSEMDSLKKKLYAKFGNTINLEET